MADSGEGGSGVPEWVVTYGDMMSLLLTFFIMLVSMSEMRDDDGRVRAMMDAIRQTFGPSQGLAGVPGFSLQSSSAMREPESAGARSEGGLKRSSRDSEGQAGAHKTVQRLNHGTVVTLGGPALFQRFDASLSDALQENLDIIADVIEPRPNRVVVRGHASPEPLPANSQYADPWDLSFARARAVANHLLERGIDRERILVSAAGDTEPRVTTRNRANQKQNRRVDVFLIDSYIGPLERTDSGGP